MYLDFACCAAVPGGGRNKEYAMHLLHLCGGNVHVSTTQRPDARAKIAKKLAKLSATLYLVIRICVGTSADLLLTVVPPNST